jgi:hypothetical protein
MRSLIANYSNNQTTEPLYINTSLNMAGFESMLWPMNTSTFDIFDLAKPDIHITHHNYIAPDLLYYLKENKSNIDLIVNITGLDQEKLTKFESIFLDNSIQPALFFVNYYDHGLQTKKTNIITLLNGADIFLGSKPKQYDIDCCVFIDKENQGECNCESYHTITYKETLANVADLFFPTDQLINIYANYDRIIFKFFNGIFDQAFFDASLRNNNVFFDIKDRTMLDIHLKKLFGEAGVCDQASNISDLSHRIKQKHTCLHRVKSLLSQLPCKEYTDKLQQIIEGSIK